MDTRSSKLEEVFLPILTENTTPHTRMPRDISKASLISSNKRDTSEEEMGVTRTQEDQEKRRNQIPSSFYLEVERGGGDGGPSITGVGVCSNRRRSTQLRN
ncbi:hypothetical protein CEXT_69591 [Caerostris extrusa]|uniref:Uncharacterized protein n=1 Tax=Caerostris extrusa TaxID=172846 RepID=A0AAV4TGB8_CAEEX|nr:hypothetical protein CEXT_69591 [Caerostris extrusa]